MLNTYVTLTARGFNAKKAVSECFDEIKNFEQKSSVYISDSEISRLNETGENTLSDELFAPCFKCEKFTRPKPTARLTSR
ncbi:MAG: FAD:protein FMN transferase [Clostridiales bacterium]|nr:MAG: FAD:protein FMN transferase [Clostridiales bacterium]